MKNLEENAVEHNYEFGVLEIYSSTPKQQLQQQQRVCGFKTSRVCLTVVVTVSVLAVALLISLAVAFGVHWNNTEKLSPTTVVIPANITVFYAASLSNLMTTLINPYYTASTGVTVITNAAASGVLELELASGAPADIFISAASSYDTLLLAKALPNQESSSKDKNKNKKIISWWTSWARSRLGIGYSTQSVYVSTFKAIANGSLPWYKGLDRTIMKIGRTDPDLDPKGARTVIMAELASIYYKTPGILANVLGTPRNTLQLYTEQLLESLLSSGSIDVGFFYECEHDWSAGDIRFIPLPVHLDFSVVGNASMNAYYSQANYTNSVTKAVTKGSAIVYTITIPNSSPHPTAAIEYVETLLVTVSGGSSSAAATAANSFYNQTGLYKYPPSFQGNVSAVPAQLLLLS